MLKTKISTTYYLIKCNKFLCLCRYFLKFLEKTKLLASQTTLSSDAYEHIGALPDTSI